MTTRTRRLFAGVVALLLLLGLTQPAAAGARDRPREFVKVGYFIQWGIYGRSFFVKNLEDSGIAGRLTHINYAFGGVAEDGVCVSVDPWADYQRPVGAAESVDGVGDEESSPLRGNFNQLKKLKSEHPELKVLISLGGWTLSKWFSDAALTAESRHTLVASCIDLFIKGNLPNGPGTGAGVFDGIDLDWEWPGSEGNPGNIIRPEDKQNFTALVAEFRDQLDALRRGVRQALRAHRLPAGRAGQDRRRVRGRRGLRRPRLRHRSGLRLPRHVGVEDQPPVAAVLATPRPGPGRIQPRPRRRQLPRSWCARRQARRRASLLRSRVDRCVPARNKGLYQSSTGAAPGTWEAGVEDYKVLATKSGQRYRDRANGANWLYDGTQWWSYDDPATIARKMVYVRHNHLGGAMVWSLDGDDSTGSLTAAIDAAL